MHWPRLTDRSPRRPRIAALAASWLALTAGLVLPLLAGPATAQVDPGAAGCGGGPAAAQLARIQQQVVAIRNLPAVDVPLCFLGADQLRARLERVYAEEYSAEQRAVDEALLRTLGLIPPDLDRARLLVDLQTEQVIGLYDSTDRVMYVIGDVAELGPGEQATLAHEYTHALQDARFNLLGLAPRESSDDDRLMAARAVIEGDALLTQVLWMQRHLTPDQILAATQVEASPQLDNAPLVLRASLLFPYMEGLKLVLAVFQQGGYEAVNALFERPPVSTEQVLHPEKYAAQEPPVPVELPDLPAALGEDWRVLDSNVLGELDTRTFVQQHTDAASAALAAQGWGGDRWALLDYAGQPAVVLKSVWDSEADAVEFVAATRSGLGRRFAGGAVVDDGAVTRIVAADGQTAAVRRQGRDVVVVIAFDRAGADALLAAL